MFSFFFFFFFFFFCEQWNDVTQSAQPDTIPMTHYLKLNLSHAKKKKKKQKNI